MALLGSVILYVPTFLSFHQCEWNCQSLWRKQSSFPIYLQRFGVFECSHTEHTVLKPYFGWQAISQHKGIIYIFPCLLFIKTFIHQIAYMASSRDVQQHCPLLLGMSEFNGSTYLLAKWLPTKQH